MAYTTINKSTDYFNTNLYTGNSGELAITGVGFQPDFWWGKKRSAAGSHILANAVSGANKFLYSDANLAETTYNEAVKSFDSDGVTIGTAGDINGNGLDFVSWNWKAGTSVSGTTTGSGTGKAYSGSVSTTAGFSIIKYLGNGSAGHTIPHHLSAVPKMILVKKLTLADWQVYHVGIGNTKKLSLNTTGAASVENTRWNSTTPTSSVFTLGASGNVNANDVSFIAYCFAEKTGYSKFGSYTGNNNADGAFVYTGFKPAFIMIKDFSEGSSNWVMYDDKRSAVPNANINNRIVYANTSADYEIASGSRTIDTLSNGFKLRGNSGDINGTASYIYMAFAAAPLVGSNNVPCTAR